MGIFGNNAVQTLYPGQTKNMLGVAALPGTPVTAAHETLAASQASSPVVVASQPGGSPSTQRQITWRVFSTSGIAGFKLQASVDNVAANYVTVDTSVGGVAVEVRTVPAEQSAAPGPGLQTATKIVSSARFFRVLNSNGSPESATIDVTCQ